MTTWLNVRSITPAHGAASSQSAHSEFHLAFPQDAAPVRCDAQQLTHVAAQSHAAQGVHVTLRGSARKHASGSVQQAKLAGMGTHKYRHESCTHHFS